MHKKISTQPNEEYKEPFDPDGKNRPRRRNFQTLLDWRRVSVYEAGYGNLKAAIEPAANDGSEVYAFF